MFKVHKSIRACPVRLHSMQKHRIPLLLLSPPPPEKNRMKISIEPSVFPFPYRSNFNKYYVQDENWSVFIQGNKENYSCADQFVFLLLSLGDRSWPKGTWVKLVKARRSENPSRFNECRSNHLVGRPNRALFLRRELSVVSVIHKFLFDTICHCWIQLIQQFNKARIGVQVVLLSCANTLLIVPQWYICNQLNWQMQL